MTFWQTLTLASVQPGSWGRSSFVHRVVGLVRPWRDSSYLLRWGEPLAGLLLALVFGTAPLLPNEALGLLLVAAAGFWGLLTVSDEPGRGLTPIHLTVLAYWGICAIATMLSPVKLAAMVGLAKLSLYLLLFALMARVLRDGRWRDRILTVMLLSSLLVSCYGMRQWLFGVEELATWVDPNSMTENTSRVYSFLGNPNLLAGYLVPPTFYGAMAVFRWPGLVRKALALLITALNALCLILTYSRGGWIGFVVGGFVLVLLGLYWLSPRLPRFWQRWLFPIVLGGLAALTVVAVAGLEPLRVRVMSIFAGRGDSSNNFRINVWMSVLKMIHDRPVLGIGPGNVAFNKVYPLYQQARYTALSAYSIPLEILVECGVIGFSIFLWVLATTFTQAAIQLQRLRTLADGQGFWLMGAIASMVGMLGHGLFDTVWYRPEVNTLWWLNVAVIASFYPGVGELNLRGNTHD